VDRFDRAAVLAIAEQIAQRREPLAHQIVERFRDDAGDGERRPDDPLVADQYAFTLANIDAFVEMLRGGEPLTAPWAAAIREAAARRVHQRVSLGFVSHSARVWGEVLWEAVLDSVRVTRPSERNAALEIASRLMHQVDVLSNVATDAYLDEITDRGLLRRDLLNALISGQGEEAAAQERARALHLTFAESYIVVLLRDGEMHGAVGQDEPLSSRVALDRIVAASRSRVRPPASSASLLAGMRNGDLVLLYPVSDPVELKAVRRYCEELGEALTPELNIGISGFHRGLRAIATAYAEARDAAALANRLDIRGRALGLDEVLVDHMLDGSAHAQRILTATLRPVCDYDREHGSALLPTLRAYVETRFNLTRSAELLTVHPNTVVYRLRRICELSGRDPHDVDDLMVLVLALKALELRAPTAAQEHAGARVAS
jgi:sugar diacid utilization regulator